MFIRLLWIGKTRSQEVKSLAADYRERICRLSPFEIVESRDPSKSRSLPPSQLIDREGEELNRHIQDGGRIVALDERGRQFTSLEFARWLQSEQDRGARSITFVIGGPDGLSDIVKSRAHLILSLGKMTWTHEMCRVLAMEQIYRALCIMRKIPYHKGGN